MTAQEAPVLLRQQFPVVDGHLNRSDADTCQKDSRRGASGKHRERRDCERPGGVIMRPSDPVLPLLARMGPGRQCSPQQPLRAEKVRPADQSDFVNLKSALAQAVSGDSATRHSS